MLRPDRDGMYCSKCGGKVETNAKFCGACGSTEPANSQPTTMSFNQAIKSCLHKYRDFSGRARRYEYWYFALFQILVLIPVVIIASFIGGVAEKILLYTMALVFLLPNLAVTSRRLHDIGKSGWLQLVWLLPTLGVFVLGTGTGSGLEIIGTVLNVLGSLAAIFGVILCAKKGTVGPNQYGPDPIIYTDDKKVPRV